MKTVPATRRAALCLLAVFALAVGRGWGEPIEKDMGLNNYENIIGFWKSVKTPDVPQTFRFTKDLQFEMTVPGRSEYDRKGTYTWFTPPTKWPLRIQVISEGKTSFYAIAVIKKDEIKVQHLDKPLEEVAFDDEDAVTLRKQP
jgi:hypothetical protein